MKVMFLGIWLFNLITSLMLLQQYCIISLLQVSVTRSLSLFLVIDVTIRVTMWSIPIVQNIRKVTNFDRFKEFKTGIFDKRILEFVGRVISVFRVISPDFKRWLHFGKLRLPNFFIGLAWYTIVHIKMPKTAAISFFLYRTSQVQVCSMES